MTSNIFLNSELFESNLELLAQNDPLTARRVELMTSPDSLQLCYTGHDELNLCRKKYGMTAYFHAESGALEECKNLMTPAIEEKGETLVVYGIGLGYFYDYLQTWLQKEKRAIIFIEDNLEVLYYFLHTERATHLLKDPKVTLFALKDYHNDYQRLLSLWTAYLKTKIDFIVLPYYAITKHDQAYVLCYTTLHDSSQINQVILEYMTGQAGFCRNFYLNLFHLPTSYEASKMFSHFKNIPAIICGAGPSIHKNIELLKTVSSKALIFAGGSSLNVLNSFGINPHFGLGIDPNMEQKHRLIANDTFHIPYFYRARVSHEAFRLIQGPKIYVSGSDNLIAKWFEEQLEIDIPLLDEGHNVINLCTEVAYHLGCNPIIYVGLDLAFTEIQTYANGIATHPLWIEMSRPYLIENQTAVNRLDIYGRPIKTKWDWIGESNWLSHYAKTHPCVEMINASEGGLGFAPVPNKSLKEVIDQHLTHSYDLSGMIHAEIQNSPMQFTMQRLVQTITQFKQSLDRCLSHYKEIINEKKQQLFKPPNKEVEPKYFTPLVIIKENEISNEIGYQYFIRSVENVKRYLDLSLKMFRKYQVPAFVQELKVDEYLSQAIQQHLELTTQAFQLHLAHMHTAASPLSAPPSQNKSEEVNIAEKESYHFEDRHLRLLHPALGIAIDFTLPSLGELICHTNRYENDQEKSVYYTYHGELFGPSRFYSPEGQLLSENWFFAGKQEGRSLQYYANGKPYSMRHFKNNLLEGAQCFFHPNGKLSVTTQYENGWLNGMVRTFHEQGQLVREISYQEGKRHGIEKMWHPNGQLMFECRYQQGIPTGEAQEWAPSGWLFKEVFIREYPKLYDVNVYNQQGEKVQAFKNGLEDYSLYYQKSQRKVEHIFDTVDHLFNQINSYIQTHQEELKSKNPALLEKLESIKKNKQGLEELRDKLRQMIHENSALSENAKEKLDFTLFWLKLLEGK